MNSRSMAILLHRHPMLVVGGRLFKIEQDLRPLVLLIVLIMFLTGRL
jgi:hypothetical protein